MSAGSNGDIVRQLIVEAWSGRNLELVDEYVAEDYLEHAPFGEATVARATVKAVPG